MDKPLAGRVALVAGGTRAAGRGIAVELGAAGATVYVTGRSTRSKRSEMNRPETIDIWGATKMEWNKTVWESDLDYGLRTLRHAVDTHAITSHFALPLLIKTPGGLVVEVTDGTTEYNASHYRVSFFYDLAKAANLRMAFALAHELKPHKATAVSLTPGWLRSEAMLDAYGVTESNWRDATKRQPHFATAASPMRGGTSSKFRMQASPPTSPAIADRRIQAGHWP
jgi:NAD(P)-dependent dehydrogenase (short-subunit alcohol dehydrogenase family)